jgi:hypothetical protein
VILVVGGKVQDHITTGTNMPVKSPVLIKSGQAWMVVDKVETWCIRWATTGRKCWVEILVRANMEMALMMTL